MFEKYGIFVTILIWRDNEFEELQNFTNHIDYLRHVICPWHLEVSTATIDAIRTLEHRTTVGDLQSILGLCNVFGRFVPIFGVLPPC